MNQLLAVLGIAIGVAGIFVTVWLAAHSIRYYISQWRSAAPIKAYEFVSLAGESREAVLSKIRSQTLEAERRMRDIAS